MFTGTVEKRIAVTGGAGFIGSHLVEKLVQRGYEVVVLDNMSTGVAENLNTVLNKIELIEGDIREFRDVSRALDGVRTVVHLAALTSVPDSMERPLAYHEVNATGTLNVLHNAVRKGVKRLIYVSTCAVYGEPLRVPVREDNPTNPLSPYASSKLSAEEYCKTFSRMGKVNTSVMRLFNVYGPRQSLNQYSGVITIFTKRTAQDQPPIIFGDGEQTRDFIYVEDVTELLAKAIESESQETFNVGSGKRTSINQLAELIIRLCGKQLKPTYEAARQGDIKHSQADISKAKKVLGFTQNVNLEDGLKRTLGVA